MVCGEMQHARCRMHSAEYEFALDVLHSAFGICHSQAPSCSIFAMMYRPCAAMVLITALRARWNCLTALTLAGAISPCWATSAFAQPPTLELVLKRTAQYVEQFVDQFSNVVAEERYVQDTLGNLPRITAGRGARRPGRPASRHRELKSDFLLVKVG